MHPYPATPTGLEYLDAITQLLQRIRLEDRFAGLYEAADLQWWWREDDAAVAGRQLFWVDEDGAWVACLLLFDDTHQWNCDAFWVPSRVEMVRARIWPTILDRLRSLDGPSTITVREDEAEFRAALESLGYRVGDRSAMQAILEHDPRPATLPSGFHLRSRADDGDRPHPMVLRNGSGIERKLGECSLYRADLDLVVRDDSGQAAAYGLFWMDPTTRVGLVEPMRTEEAFQGQGIAAAILSEGIRRLRAAGAETIKISYRIGNEPASRLYHRAGFRDLFRKLELRKGHVPDSLSKTVEPSF